MKFKVEADNEVNNHLVGVKIAMLNDDDSVINEYGAELALRECENVVDLTSLKYSIINLIIDFIAMERPTKMTDDMEESSKPSIVIMTFKDNDNIFHFYNIAIDENGISEESISKARELLSSYNLTNVNQQESSTSVPRYSYPDQHNIFINKDMIVNFKSDSKKMRESRYKKFFWVVSITEANADINK